MLVLHIIHFPSKSRDISWGIPPKNLCEIPYFTVGDLPCNSVLIMWKRRISDFSDIFM
jgi:hypothetical protein